MRSRCPWEIGSPKTFATSAVSTSSSMIRPTLSTGGLASLTSGGRSSTSPGSFLPPSQQRDSRKTPLRGRAGPTGRGASDRDGRNHLAGRFNFDPDRAAPDEESRLPGAAAPTSVRPGRATSRRGERPFPVSSRKHRSQWRVYPPDSDSSLTAHAARVYEAEQRAPG